GDAGKDVEPVRGDDVHERERWRVSSRRHAYAVLAGDARLPEPGVALCSLTTCSPGTPTPTRSVNSARRAAGRARARRRLLRALRVRRPLPRRLAGGGRTAATPRTAGAPTATAPTAT